MQFSSERIRSQTTFLRSGHADLNNTRLKVEFTSELENALLTYAAVASAVGLVLVSPQQSEAKIIYTPAHQIIGKNARYHLDLNHDRLPDFTLVNKHDCNTDFCIDVLSAIPAAGNGVEGKPGFLSIPYAYALKRGALVGPKQPFAGKLMASSDSGQGTIGRWLNVTNGYLGLKFKIHGQTHYGWARLTVKILGSATIRTTLTGYAYETIPNRPIVAGRTIGTDDPGDTGQTLPIMLKNSRSKDSSLGVLALGAPGLSIWRRKNAMADQTAA
jgi:hypothetical protein